METPVNSVAVWAKEAGHKVGIATSVSVDHATPAAFYAHAAGRSSYYSIGKDLYRTGFDFYAGSDFLEPVDKSGKDTENLYDLAAKNGYAIARGYKDYQKKSKKPINSSCSSRKQLLKRTAIPSRMPLTVRKTT